MDLAALVRDVPDHPSPGIVFKDLTPLLADPAGLREAVDRLVAGHEPGTIDKVAAIVRPKRIGGSSVEAMPSWLNAMRTAPMGPWNGMPEICRAADAPLMASTS